MPRSPGWSAAVREYLLDMREAQNLLVLRTPPGGAQPLAAALDAGHWQEVTGTIGGDDTVLVITPSRKACAALQQENGGAAEMSDAGRRARVAVVGATGYAGVGTGAPAAAASAVGEAHLLSARQRATVHCLSELFPEFAGWGEAPCRPFSVEAVAASGADVVFLSTPHEVSLELVPPLLQAGMRVVDLSGAFRFRAPETFAHWYKLPAAGPGIRWPWRFTACRRFMAEALPSAGWWQSGLLSDVGDSGLRPLMAAGWSTRERGVVCDCKSGASGAGKDPSASCNS